VEQSITRKSISLYSFLFPSFLESATSSIFLTIANASLQVATHRNKGFHGQGTTISFHFASISAYILTSGIRKGSAALTVVCALQSISVRSTGDNVFSLSQVILPIHLNSSSTAMSYSSARSFSFGLSSVACLIYALEARDAIWK
jgi:hypothetical protein